MLKMGYLVREALSNFIPSLIRKLIRGYLRQNMYGLETKVI